MCLINDQSKWSEDCAPKRCSKFMNSFNCHLPKICFFENYSGSTMCMYSSLIISFAFAKNAMKWFFFGRRNTNFQLSSLLVLRAWSQTPLLFHLKGRKSNNVANPRPRFAFSFSCVQLQRCEKKRFLIRYLFYDKSWK